MSTAPVPPYPVVYVDVARDGSAHVNVAGRHENFDPGPSEATRSAVTAYAAGVAAELRRPVRMRITDPDGQWLVAVHPNGTVTELADAAPAARRPARKQTVAVPTAATLETLARPVAPTPTPTPTAPAYFRPPVRDTRPIASPPEPVSSVPTPSAAMPHPELDPELERTQIAKRSVKRRTPAVPTATLAFSTGDVAHVTGAVLIGRKPSADPGEDVDLTLAVDDESRMLSRTHLRIEWHDDGLWATDRASSNGTSVERDGEAPVELTPWQPFQLRDDDVVVLGDVRLTISLAADGGEVNL